MADNGRSILVTGGAGFIGSHMVKLLCAGGYRVTTVDSLVNGHRDAVVGGVFIRGDLGDRAFLARLFGRQRFDCVIHFASFIQVGESVTDPAAYYRNNLVNTHNLVEAMVASGSMNLIFSSSAAIFGEPEEVPIPEDHPRRPLSPYGRSKMVVEEILADFGHAYGLNSVSLRYFNAAGADPDGELGERHDPETHLIPLVLQAASGRRPGITVFGADHDTADGTCVRDYIHVNDLCQAHVLAMEKLWRDGGTRAYNLGNGQGFSVREVIMTAMEVTGREIRVDDAPRRAGDCAVLVADSGLAVSELGWRPRFPELATMISHAWNFEQKIAGLR